ncbi:hypothetical protein [Actinomadura verrucosospora]|uniref:Succinyl-CoA ligase domain-containing protein n=1 Tax=Actinomadura verrucosospora TaxID=46165 RepID=A0A7D3ZRB8_ACTVE|nr:hypothetical protein [Actinomadura verrucosospora]QKG27341.1 succinyl-CoA ligase domain-containing protein [Actinomadura verrucosospora]
MIGSGTAAARWARGGFLTAACTLLSLAGHAAGGACCLPPLPAVLGTGGVVGALCVGLAGRMMSFRRILAVVGWAQAAFHLAFTVSASSPGHHMAPGAEPMAAPGLAMGPQMLAGHAAAALAAAVLLAYAERALWWLYGAVFATVLTRLIVRSPAASHRPPWPVVVADDPAPRRGVLLARAVRRRGPPPVVLPHAA